MSSDRNKIQAVKHLEHGNSHVGRTKTFTGGLMFKEKPTNSKHTGKIIMNFVSFGMMSGDIRDSMDPTKVASKVREMKDMTPEEIEAIKRRYGESK